MNTLIHLLLSFLAFCAIAQSATPAQSLTLQAQNLNTKSILKLGELRSGEALEIIDVPESLDVGEGDYCLGAEIEGAFKCYTYVDKLSPQLGYEVVLHNKPAGGLVSISFLKADEAGLTVKTSPVGAGPNPITKKTKTKAQDAQGASPGATEEEEEEQSFLKKYWMYIVPFVVLMLVSGGGEGGQ